MAYYLATLVLMIVLIVFTALSSYAQVCSVCLCSGLHLLDIIIPPTKRPGVHATAFSVVHVREREQSSPFFGSSCLNVAQDDVAYHKQTVKLGRRW